MLRRKQEIPPLSSKEMRAQLEKQLEEFQEYLKNNPDHFLPRGAFKELYAAELSAKQIRISSEDKSPFVIARYKKGEGYAEILHLHVDGNLVPWWDFQGMFRVLDKSGNNVVIALGVNPVSDQAEFVIGNAKSGRIQVMGEKAKRRVEISGEEGSIRAFDPDGANIHIGIEGPEGSPTIAVGGVNQAGTIRVRDTGFRDTVIIDGKTGDITLANADCAEQFDLAAGYETQIEPGMVMVIQDDGIRPCDQISDHRVVGVVSGAGSYRPALLLDKRETGQERVPVALMGKVFCRAVDLGGQIKAGDLLMTSDVPGHAMRIGKERTPGSVLGKALKPLVGGSGLIPILVTLQ